MGAFRFKNQETTRRIDVLPPEPSGRTRHRPGSPGKLDIVDAEFEIVPAGARRQPYRVFNDNKRETAGSPNRRSGRGSRLTFGGLFKAVWSIEAGLQKKSQPVFAGLVAAAFTFVFLGAAAFAGIGAVPAPFVEASGLHVAGISTSLDARDGLQVLSVYGRVVNSGTEPQPMPRILVDVMAGDKRISTSSLTPQGSSIASGQTSYFSTRLPHSGGKKPDVRVSLAPMGAPGN